MTKSDEIKSDIQSTIDTKWTRKKGTDIPSIEDITLSCEAIEIEAAFLFADLANSSKMVMEWDQIIMARILKSFLSSATKLIEHNEGKAISYDGDRVTGIFYGDHKINNAVKCALQINYVVKHIIKPKFEKGFDTVKNASFEIHHCTGIDTGTTLAVRVGVKGSNDIVWIERAPYLASKLSDLRESPYHTFITAQTYQGLGDETRYNDKKDSIWEKKIWTFHDNDLEVYRSLWTRKP